MTPVRTELKEYVKIKVTDTRNVIIYGVVTYDTLKRTIAYAEVHRPLIPILRKLRFHESR